METRTTMNLRNLTKSPLVILNISFAHTIPMSNIWERGVHINSKMKVLSKGTPQEIQVVSAVTQIPPSEGFAS